MHILFIFLVSISSGYSYGSAGASIERGVQDSFFGRETDLLKRKIDNVFHPILHGCAEIKGKTFWTSLGNAFSNSGKNFLNFEFKKAYKNFKDEPEIWSAAKNVTAGIITTICGAGVERVLFNTGFYKPDEGGADAGRMALQAILDAERDVERAYPSWKPQRDCPHGITNCSKLGANSKGLLAAIDTFFSHISEYEQSGKSFFSDEEEVNRLITFLANLTQRICEENVVFATANKGPSVIDDKELKPYFRVINYLLAVPTGMHDIKPHWVRSSAEIDKLLSFLPCHEQNEIFEYMGTLLLRASDPTYGHKSGDSSTHLLISGPSGTGKTYVAIKLLELLGFPVIKITLKELQEGQDTSYNDLESLVEGGALSGIETKVLCLKSRQNKGISSLNPVFFIDELDEDRDYTVSDLKDQLDQFKRWRLSSLGLTLPGFMSCIFTTNNSKLIKDPALASRFCQIAFLEMTVDKKVAILLDALYAKIEQKPELLQMRQGNVFYDIIKRYVEYDNGNLRILLANLDCVISHFETTLRVSRGEGFLVPPSQRNGNRETFDQFLVRKFPNKSGQKKSKKKAAVSYDSSSYDSSSDD